MTQIDDRPATTPDEAKPPLESTAHVLSAIQNVMAEVRGFAKTGEMRVGYGNNAKVQYHFQRWDDMAAKIGDAFRNHGIATQTVLRDVDRYRFDKAKNDSTQLWIHTTVVVRFAFTSLVDGSTFTIESSGEALDNSDKGVNKAITAAYKNACKVAFTLSTEDDGDPDATRPQVTEQVRNAPNGQRQQGQPDPREDAVWSSVENAATQPVEQAPEPSRLEIAVKAMSSMQRARTTGDLATIAAWAIGKGALMADPVGGTGPSLAQRILAMRGTLPVGPRSQAAMQTQRPPAPAGDAPPPEEGY